MARLSLKDAIEWAEGKGYTHTVKNGNKHTLVNVEGDTKNFENGTELVKWVKPQLEGQVKSTPKETITRRTNTPEQEPEETLFFPEDIPMFDSPLGDIEL